MVAVLAAYSSEVYPTLGRPRGTGLAAGASKAGGVLVISVVVAAVAPPAIAATALIGAIPMALAALAALFFGVETRKRRLENITVQEFNAATPSGAPGAVMNTRRWNQEPPVAHATAGAVTSPPPLTALSAAKPAVSGGPHLTLGKRTIPVVLPDRRDPRLKLAAVIITLKVLGQTGLDFKVSIAQILVTVGLCAVIDTTVTLHRQGVLAWPASALLTGEQHRVHPARVRHRARRLVESQRDRVLRARRAGLPAREVPGAPRRASPLQPVERRSRMGAAGHRPRSLVSPVPLVGGTRRPGDGRAGGDRARRDLGARSGPNAADGALFPRPIHSVDRRFAASGRSFLAIWHEGPISGFDYWLNICTSPNCWSSCAS